MKNLKTKRFLQRKRRVRAKIVGQDRRPRLAVFRSNKYIYAQLIDDVKGVTLAAASSKDIKAKAGGRLVQASLVGEMIAKKALRKKIKKVIFDRGGYKYHGRIKSLAEGARKGGLGF